MWGQWVNLDGRSYTTSSCFVFYPNSSHLPQSGGERWDATEEGEGDDDEEEGEEGWHVVAGAATLPC